MKTNRESRETPDCDDRCRWHDPENEPVVTDKLLWEMPNLGNKAYWIRQAKEQKAHTERLAKALREIAPKDRQLPPPAIVRQIVAEALAAWEAQK